MIHSTTISQGIFVFFPQSPKRILKNIHTSFPKLKSRTVLMLSSGKILLPLLCSGLLKTIMGYYMIENIVKSRKSKKDLSFSDGRQKRHSCLGNSCAST